MKQVFVNQKCEVNQRIPLTEEQAHHLFDVLRIRKKEVVRVVSRDSVFLARPEDRPYLYVFNRITTEQVMHHITLCAALVKQDRFEWLLQKACELGVTRIVPFTSRNTIIRLDALREKKKLDRWSKIIVSASEQCNRNDLVELTPIQTIDTLHMYQSKCNLVAYEKEDDPFRHLSTYLMERPDSVTVCIGPEGGFEAFEIAALKENHFQTCSLGNYILRAETAACYVLSAIEFSRHIKKEET